MTPPQALAGAAPIDDRERGCWVAFSHVPGIGPVRIRRLLEHFGSLAQAWVASPTGLSLAGLDRRTLAGLLALRATLEPPRELERARRGGGDVIVWPDDTYPWRLAAIPDPPPVLYLRGTLLPADSRTLAIVGTRRPTYYGREIAERLARSLAEAGLAVVSGLARGIDTQAHRGALAGGGRTIAVLGHGLDTIYPPENRRLAAEIAERGALLSDYPPGTAPEAQHFPPRNRIISGLAAGVLVVEAGAQSGALITTRFAAEQGRDVFAVPGPITSPASVGCHRLIQDGAKLVIEVGDILTELEPARSTAGASGAPSPPAQQMALRLSDPPEGLADPLADPAVETSQAAARLLRTLGEAGQPTHIDIIARKLAMPVHLVTGELARLELLGQVQHVGGMRYVLTAPT